MRLHRYTNSALDNYPLFGPCFHHLSLILSRESLRSPRSTSTTYQQFTTPDTATFSTPEQATQVLREHVSLVEDSPQSTELNRSAKLEHPTASFANGFLRATYFFLAKHLVQQAWFKDPSQLLLPYNPWY